MSGASSTSSVLGLGIALPAWTLEQGRAAEHAADRSADTAKRRAVVERLYRKSGVARRPVVLRELVEGDGEGLLALPIDAHDAGPTTAARLAHYLPAATSMASEAAGVALQRSGVEAGEVTHLVTASCTGFAAPNVDVALIDALGLPRSTQRTHVGFMGCHAALNALRVADALARGEAGAVVLVVAVEVCSVHLAYGWDPQAIVSNALFGDAAGAAVVSAGGSSSESPGWRLIDRASWVLPDTHDAMTWTITDHGVRMTLSNRVPGLIEGSLRPVVEGLLDRHGLAVASIDHWAVHPGGPQVLTSTAAALGLPDEAVSESRAVLREVGNLSSPTVLLILDRLALRALAGEWCVALAFGPGLTVEAGLLRWGA